MREVPYKLWTEQNETYSRLMIQIGGDRPYCMLQFARALAQPQNIGMFFDVPEVPNWPEVPNRKDHA